MDVRPGSYCVAVGMVVLLAGIASAQVRTEVAAVSSYPARLVLDPGPLLTPEARFSGAGLVARPAVPAPAFSAPASTAAVDTTRSAASRPKWVWPLYGLTALVQAADAHSTFEALDAGGMEANEMVSALTANRLVFSAFKASAATGLIVASDTLGGRHRTTSVIMLMAVNSAYAMLARHNYRVAAQMRAATR